MKTWKETFPIPTIIYYSPTILLVTTYGLTPNLWPTYSPIENRHSPTPMHVWVLSWWTNITCQMYKYIDAPPPLFPLFKKRWLKPKVLAWIPWELRGYTPLGHNSTRMGDLPRTWFVRATYHLGSTQSWRGYPDELDILNQSCGNVEACPWGR